MELGLELSTRELRCDQRPVPVQHRVLLGVVGERETSRFPTMQRGDVRNVRIQVRHAPESVASWIDTTGR
jgi:hypothetical protein